MKKPGLIILSFLALAWLSMTIQAQTIDKIQFATEATYPPYVYLDADGKVQGYDIDVAKALCERIAVRQGSPVACTFAHQAWDSLIPSLQNGRFDAIHGGMTITSARLKQVDFTLPTSQAAASIMAAKGATMALVENTDKPVRVGVQQGTIFIHYIQDHYPHVSIKTYSSIQEAFSDLQTGRVQAVMGDHFVNLEWLRQWGADQYFDIISGAIVHEDLFGEGDAIAVRKGNTLLLNQLNQALLDIEQDGTLDTLKEHYFYAPTVRENQNFIPLFLQGLIVTIKLAVTALFLGLILGVIAALGEKSSYRVLSYFTLGFTSLFRGLPELLVILFIYFGGSYILQEVFGLAIYMSAFVSGVIALSVIFASYAAQVFRSAFLSINKGQVIAALAVGMPSAKLYRRIILPQLWRHALPGLSNLWMILLKDTALVSLIGLPDLMANAQAASIITQQPFTFYLLAALLYLGLTSISQFAYQALNKRANIHVRVT